MNNAFVLNNARGQSHINFIPISIVEPQASVMREVIFCLCVAGPWHEFQAGY